MQNIGDNMTIFAVFKTFIGNNAAFINRKNSLPRWAVISVYVLNLKGDGQFFKNNGVHVSYSLQYLFFCWQLSSLLPDSWLSWEKGHLQFIPLPQMQISRCAYEPSSLLTSLLSACAVKHLLEIVLRAVVAFPGRKGVVVLEYKYNNVLNVIHYFKE